MKKSMLRIVFTSILMSVLLFTASVSANYAAEDVFSDVDSSSESYEAIKYLKNNDVVVGYDDGSYKPDETINRAEFLKIVMEAYGYDVGGYSGCFPDVTDQWFAPHICKAEAMGIVDGYDSGYFMPDWEINFAEASKIVAEAFRLTADTSDSDAWFQQYVVSLELLSAIPTSVNSFNKNITRGEMAEMVWRIKAEKTTKASNTYDSIKTGETSSVASGDVTSISLIDKGDGNVKWLSDGYSGSGFKLVWSKTSGPTYPTRSGDKYKYHSDPSTYLSSVYEFDGDGTYYVRVCEYLGGACGVYSNEITVELTGDSSKDEALVDDEDVNSITLVDDFNGDVSWVVDGTSTSGYKLVWSLTSEPTYPTRSGDKYAYYSDSSVASGSIDSFGGAGTYYVRVCEYLGGACGVYSNEVEVEMSVDSSEEEAVVSGDVASITLVNDFNGSVSWVVDGASVQGYKVVWSKTPGPTYPTRDGDEYYFYSDLLIDSTDLEAFDGDGTYFVRVCEYLGGDCGVYSNEVEVELTEVAVTE